MTLTAPQGRGAQGSLILVCLPEINMEAVCGFVKETQARVLCVQSPILQQNDLRTLCNWVIPLITPLNNFQDVCMAVVTGNKGPLSMLDKRPLQIVTPVHFLHHSK